MTLADDTYDRLIANNDPYPKALPLDELAKAVRRRNYREFVGKWIGLLSVYRERNNQMFSHEEYEYFTDALDLWLKTASSPAFQLEDGDEALFSLNANITNFLAITPHRNGDAALKKVLDNNDNLAKVLLLYTPRSNYELRVDKFWEADPVLTSLWYSCVWNWVDSYISPHVYEQCRRLVDAASTAFQPFDSDIVCGYFRCTYVNNMRDREVKRTFINGIRRFTQDATIRNSPNPKSIAVVSAFWNGTHAVYRAFAPYVAELARDYDLTLVHLSQPVTGRKEPVTEHFKQVKTIQASSDAIALSEVANNDFQLAYFPDVGMSQESMYLASMRLAPIQCMGTGHPVSAASPTMDYFISGGEVETPDNPGQNYDERLVLLPGLSVHPVKPVYKPEFPEPPAEYYINCPWMHMKNNMPVIRLLRKILDRASKPVVFQFYPGCAFTCNSSHMATIQDFSEILPMESFIMHHSYEYDHYMRTLENGRFAMHSYPFGGGTTAVDALIMGKPLLVRRGSHEYNRFSAALLTRIGLEELVADSDDKWIEIALKLIDSPAYLEDVSRRVREADLDNAIFRVEDAGMLRRAFGELIRNHHTIQKDPSRKPIPIG